MIARNLEEELILFYSLPLTQTKHSGDHLEYTSEIIKYKTQ